MEIFARSLIRLGDMAGGTELEGSVAEVNSSEASSGENIATLSMEFGSSVVRTVLFELLEIREYPVNLSRKLSSSKLLVLILECLGTTPERLVEISVKYFSRLGF